MTTAKATFYRSLGLTGAIPDMEKQFYEGNYAKVPYILAQSAVPVCLAPNGTVATNGIVTLGTALPATYSGGIWLRLPANAVVGGSAGLYWAVMSSTTQGQVYTNFADPASEFIPYVPSGALVAATGSNSAYTQTTGADITLASVTVPGGAMGLSGSLRWRFALNTANNANTKTLNIRLNSTPVYTSPGFMTSQANASGDFNTRVMGVPNRQINVGPTSGSGGSVGYSSINTSADMAVTITAQLNTVATDYVVFNYGSFEVLPS